MNENAFVCWTVSDQPWVLEAAIIRSINLPLNGDDFGSPCADPVQRAGAGASISSRMMTSCRHRRRRKLQSVEGRLFSPAEVHGGLLN
jgi:hypothetical protein